MLNTSFMANLTLYLHKHSFGPINPDTTEVVAKYTLDFPSSDGGEVRSDSEVDSFCGLDDMLRELIHDTKGLLDLLTPVSAKYYRVVDCYFVFTLEADAGVTGEGEDAELLLGSQRYEAKTVHSHIDGLGNGVTFSETPNRLGHWYEQLSKAFGVSLEDVRKVRRVA